MPIYEYVCENCTKRLSFFILKTESFFPHCQKCGATNLRRIMSRFAAVRSEESRLESLADPGKWGDLDENDPKSIVKFIKKMGREMGEDLGENYGQLIEEAEQEAENVATNTADSQDDE